MMFTNHKESSLFALEHHKINNYCDIRKGRWHKEETSLLICVLEYECVYDTILDSRDRIICDRISNYIWVGMQGNAKKSIRKLKIKMMLEYSK